MGNPANIDLLPSERGVNERVNPLAPKLVKVPIPPTDMGILGSAYLNSPPRHQTLLRTHKTAQSQIIMEFHSLKRGEHQAVYVEV